VVQGHANHRLAVNAHKLVTKLDLAVEVCRASGVAVKDRDGRNKSLYACMYACMYTHIHISCVCVCVCVCARATRVCACTHQQRVISISQGSCTHLHIDDTLTQKLEEMHVHQPHSRTPFKRTLSTLMLIPPESATPSFLMTYRSLHIALTRPSSI